MDRLELFSLEKTKREEHGYGKIIYSVRKEKNMSIVFTIRVVRHQNRLPKDAVDAPSPKMFKARVKVALVSLIL